MEFFYINLGVNWELDTTNHFLQFLCIIKLIREQFKVDFIVQNYNVLYATLNTSNQFNLKLALLHCLKFSLKVLVLTWVICLIGLTYLNYSEHSCLDTVQTQKAKKLYILIKSSVSHNLIITSNFISLIGIRILVAVCKVILIGIVILIWVCIC